MRSVRLVQAERIKQWLGEEVVVEAMAGGASPRTYWRVRSPSGTKVVMALPDDPFKADEAADAQVVTELPWLTMARELGRRGVPVPEVYRVDVAAGFVLIEDLGDERFFDVVQRGDRVGWYDQALALWRVWRRRTQDLTVAATFGRAHMQAELDEFRAMGLEARLGITLTVDERATLDGVFADLIDRLEALPKVLSHRDFQSQNLMHTPRGLVLIDFQDAFMAPEVYDAVALLRDSYVVLSPHELTALLARHGIDEAAFHLQTIQRKLKDSGRFETLARKGKPHYLQYFGDSIRYVVHALETTGLYPDLLALLRKHLSEAR